MLGEGENPLTWSVPIVRLPRLMLRLHLVFVVFIAVRTVQSVQTQQAGLVFQLIGLAGLLLLVAIHEFAHVFAARRVGVLHDRLVLWPLGGLDHGDQPDRPGQLAAVALSGPIVNLLLLGPLTALTLATSGSWDLVFFDPFAYRGAAVVASAEGLGAWLCWSLHASNLMLLGLNLLVPMHPFDAGRLLHAAVWKLRGEVGAARVSGAVGIVSAAVLAAVGLIANESVLLGIAMIGAFVSWQEISRARFLTLEHTDWTPKDDPADPFSSEPVSEEVRPDEAEVDRILGKISEQGLSSLTEAERRVLDRASAASKDI